MTIKAASATFASLKAFAALYPAYTHQVANKTLPMVTLNDFETFAKSTRQISGLSLLAFSPYITSNEQRLPWEEYSRNNQGWIHRGFEQSDPNYDGHPGDHDPITGFIWRNKDNNGLPQAHYGAPPLSPLWQLSPPPNDTMLVNRDLLSSEAFQQIFEESIGTGKSTLSRPIDVLSILGANIRNPEKPHSIFLEPVLSQFGDAGEVVGSIVAVFPWENYLSSVCG